MPRKIVVSEDGRARFGIRITNRDGSVGWVAGEGGDYLLFDTQAAATKALRKLKQNDNYSWNCTAEVGQFSR